MFNKKDVKKNSGFSLIELLVAMTIFFIMVAFSYVPYSYYQSKAQLRQGVKELSQSFYDARNMAIGGLSLTGNLSIGLYLDKQDNNKITYISYPYNYTGSLITNNIGGKVKIEKELDLPVGVEIMGVGIGTDLRDNGLFFFESITGKGDYFYWDASGTKQKFGPGDLIIKLSYKNSSSVNLQSEIKYYTDNNIVDY